KNGCVTVCVAPATLTTMPHRTNQMVCDFVRIIANLHCPPNVAYNAFLSGRSRKWERGRLSAVDVGELVLASQIADGVQLSGLVHSVWIFGECSDRAAQILGGLGDAEVERVGSVGCE